MSEAEYGGYLSQRQYSEVSRGGGISYNRPIRVRGKGEKYFHHSVTMMSNHERKRDEYHIMSENTIGYIFSILVILTAL